jgi:methionyl-tRNA formyltransferase
MSNPANDSAGISPGTPRVVLLTSPGLFGAQIINRLARDAGFNLVGVGLTDRLYKGKGLARSVWTFVRRTGWRYVCYNALHSQVAWIRLRTSGRPSGLKRVHGQVRLLRDVNSPETVDWLRSLAPEFVASFFFNQLIGTEVQQVPQRACINMHPSLLPALRGPDPIFRALERGLATSGHTIHEVTEAIDGGPVLFQRSCPIPQPISAFELYARMVREGADLLADWLAGRLEPAPPPAPSGAGDYSTFPRPEEVRAFLRAGHHLITLRELHRSLAEIE